MCVAEGPWEVFHPQHPRLYFPQLTSSTCSVYCSLWHKSVRIYTRGTAKCCVKQEPFAKPTTDAATTTTTTNHQPSPSSTHSTHNLKGVDFILIYEMLLLVVVVYIKMCIKPLLPPPLIYHLLGSL